MTTMMTPLHGIKKAETGELAAAKIEVETAREKVDAAENALSKKKAALTACDKADETQHKMHFMEYEALYHKFKVLVEQWQGAVSHFNSVRSQSDKERFDMMVASSPTVKHMRDAIASVEPDAVIFWDFCHPDRELSQKDRKKLWTQTARHYKVYKKDGKLVRCQLARRWGNNQQVTTSHLLKHGTRHHMRKVFEFDDINDKRNLLMLSKGVEKAFETGRIYFEGGNNDRTFIMRILDQTVKDELIFDGSDMKIGSLEGKKLLIPKDVQPPFKRVLSHHAQDAYRMALERGFITRETEPPIEYGSPLKDNLLDLTQATTESVA